MLRLLHLLVQLVIITDDEYRSEELLLVAVSKQANSFPDPATELAGITRKYPLGKEEADTTFVLDNQRLCERCFCKF